MYCHISALKYPNADNTMQTNEPLVKYTLIILKSILILLLDSITLKMLEYTLKDELWIMIILEARCYNLIRVAV